MLIYVVLLRQPYVPEWDRDSKLTQVTLTLSFDEVRLDFEFSDERHVLSTGDSFDYVYEKVMMFTRKL